MCIELILIHVSIGETDIVLSMHVNVIVWSCVISYDSVFLVVLYLLLCRVLVV